MRTSLCSSVLPSISEFSGTESKITLAGGAYAQIFAGLMTHHYEPPSEFLFDIKSENSPIQVLTSGSFKLFVEYTNSDLMLKGCYTSSFLFNYVENGNCHVL